MSKLEAALAWARRGYPVFPLVPNGKEPAFGEDWTELSTTDETVIRSMWSDPLTRIERDYNIGVDCTGRVVIDIDVKDGKDGYNEYAQLTGDTAWGTLCVQTPTGGYHLYFEGDDVGNAPISPGVDVRSHHGYVVGPGSTIDGRRYEVVRDVEAAWLPGTLSRYLTAYIDGSARRDFQVSWQDSPATINAATQFLLTAPAAVEGQRGDETTYIVTAKLVREYGLSPQTALDLLIEHYNPRCSPPWSLDELHQKVENATEYGTADLGRLDVGTLFGGLALTPPPSLFEQVGHGEEAEWGNALDPDATPPRPWMVDRLLMVSEITLMIAAGSAGKSTLGLVIAAHLAMGADFGPYKTHTKCKTVIYNGEDDRAEQSRRLQAVCHSYGFPWEEVRKHVAIFDASDFALSLVTREGSKPVENTAMIDTLIAKLSHPECGLFIGDPIGDLHEVDENDPSHMNAVIRVLKRVARQANVACMIMTHSTKGGTHEDRVGNMDILRGSSATVYKARMAFTLMGMSESDAENYGVQPAELGHWVRMDDAKMNLSLKGEQMLWFKRQGVKIASGDMVGVLHQEPLTVNTMFIKMRIAGLLIDNMIATNSSTMQITQAASFIRNNEPLWATKTETEIRSRLEAMFGVVTEVQGKRLQVKRGESGDKPIVILS